MFRLPVRTGELQGAAWAAALLFAAPLSAQQVPPEDFRLPEATPTPAPAPAGPADERAGVTIPPRAVPSPIPSPTAAPAAPPAVSESPLALPAPPVGPPNGERTAAARPNGSLDPAAPSTALLPSPSGAPGNGSEPTAPRTAVTLPGASNVPATRPGSLESELPPLAVPEWWPLVAAAVGVLLLAGAAAAGWRRRRRRAPDLAAPVAASTRPDPAPELPRLDLALEITGATRSVMMFTLEWRLTIANRSEQAVNDLALVVQLACARAGSGTIGLDAPDGDGEPPVEVARIGPHQARAVSGTVQLPLSAIAPLRQRQTPLFVPLVHVALESRGQRTPAKSFVIGTPSASGRVHPIPLDRPPGRIYGLIAQAIALPPSSAAA